MQYFGPTAYFVYIIYSYLKKTILITENVQYDICAIFVIKRTKCFSSVHVETIIGVLAIRYALDEQVKQLTKQCQHEHLVGRVEHLLCAKLHCNTVTAKVYVNIANTIGSTAGSHQPKHKSVNWNISRQHNERKWDQRTQIL